MYARWPASSCSPSWLEMSSATCGETNRESSVRCRSTASIRRAFAIAIAAWSAKVCTSAMCSSVNGLGSRRDEHHDADQVVLDHDRDAEHRAVVVRGPPDRRTRGRRRMSGMWTDSRVSAARPAAVVRSSACGCSWSYSALLELGCGAPPRCRSPSLEQLQGAVVGPRRAARRPRSPRPTPAAGPVLRATARRTPLIARCCSRMSSRSRARFGPSPASPATPAA